MDLNLITTAVELVIGQVSIDLRKNLAHQIANVSLDEDEGSTSVESLLEEIVLTILRDESL